MSDGKKDPRHEDGSVGFDGSDDPQQLEAERELARDELRGTIAALAHKADVPSRGKEALHEYIKGAQDKSTKFGEYARHQADRVTHQSRNQLLTRGAVLTAAALGLAVIVIVWRQRLPAAGHGRPRTK